MKNLQTTQISLQAIRSYFGGPERPHGTDKRKYKTGRF